MKKLLLSIGLALTSLTAFAQSTTNIVLTIKVTDAVSTNTTTLTATTDYVQGFAIGYASNVKLNGTNAPTFTAYVKQTIADLLHPLQDQSVADALTTNKVAAGAALLPSLWPTMTLADRTNLAAIFQKYVQ